MRTLRQVVRYPSTSDLTRLDCIGKGRVGRFSTVATCLKKRTRRNKCTHQQEAATEMILSFPSDQSNDPGERRVANSLLKNLVLTLFHRERIPLAEPVQ